MDDDELIRRAKAGEIVGSGAYQIQVLTARLATMEAAVRAADRLLDASEPSPCGMSRVYGKLDQAEKHMNADRQAFNAASELLEEPNDT